MPRRVTNRELKDRLVTSLAASPRGLTRGEIYRDVFGGAVKSDAIDAISTELLSEGTIEEREVLRQVTVTRKVRVISLARPERIG